MLIRQFVILLLLSVNFTLLGQDYQNNHLNLLVLLVDEDYEKCLKKSLKITDQQETRKQPLPYLYASMAYFQMSRDSEFRSDYPKAFKSSISYLGKYRRKDPSFEYKEDALKFIEKIKFILAENIENNKLLYEEEKAEKKNKSIYKKIAKMDPNDFSIEVLKGVSEYKSASKSAARKVLKENVPYLDSISKPEKFETLTESQQYFYKKALISYAKFVEEKEPEEAKRILNLGKKYFIDENSLILLPDNSDFKKAYNSLISN